MHCAFLLHIISYVISEHMLKTWFVFLDAKPGQYLNGYFLLNKHGELSFLSRYFNLPIILFMLKNFKKNWRQKNVLPPEIYACPPLMGIK